jgi:hypothetical protein
MERPAAGWSGSLELPREGGTGGRYFLGQVNGRRKIAKKCLDVGCPTEHSLLDRRILAVRLDHARVGGTS